MAEEEQVEGEQADGKSGSAENSEEEEASGSEESGSGSEEPEEKKEKAVVPVKQLRKSQKPNYGPDVFVINTSMCRSELELL